MEKINTQKEPNTPSNPWWKKLDPAVPNRWLLLLAGGMWSAVGIMLVKYAITWLTVKITLLSIAIGVAGIGISILAHRFQFGKLAKKNIQRILQLSDRACIFSFQAWKGYLIIAVMISGGILLRNSALPKVYMAIVYMAIGGALLQASFHYYLEFFTKRNIPIKQLSND